MKDVWLTKIVPKETLPSSCSKAVTKQINGNATPKKHTNPMKACDQKASRITNLHGFGWFWSYLKLHQTSQTWKHWGPTCSLGHNASQVAAMTFTQRCTARSQVDPGYLRFRLSRQLPIQTSGCWFWNIWTDWKSTSPVEKRVAGVCWIKQCWMNHLLYGLLAIWFVQVWKQQPKSVGWIVSDFCHWQVQLGSRLGCGWPSTFGAESHQTPS